MEDAAHGRPYVLLLEGPDDWWGAFAARIESLGYWTLRVETIEEAEKVLESGQPEIHCAVLPADFADRRLKRALKGLRKRAPQGGLHLVAVGPEPEAQQRKFLRAAGVLDALWEPFDDDTLRFELNRLTLEAEPLDVREAQRVPSGLGAIVSFAGREREATIYSVSESGAYLATPRGCLDGAEVTVLLQLPTGPLSVPAIVVFANVIGNLRRPNIPLGMGVRFSELPPGDAKMLREYVEGRRAQITV